MKGHLSQKINVAPDKIQTWLESYNLNISFNKNKCMLFTKDFFEERYHKKLKWNIHVNHMEVKVNQSLNAMWALCGSWWGCKPTILKMIHKATVMSHI